MSDGCIGRECHQHVLRARLSGSGPGCQIFPGELVHPCRGRCRQTAPTGQTPCLSASLHVSQNSQLSDGQLASYTSNQHTSHTASQNENQSLNNALKFISSCSIQMFQFKIESCKVLSFPPGLVSDKQWVRNCPAGQTPDLALKCAAPKSSINLPGPAITHS
jgi:hypothetical protein